MLHDSSSLPLFTAVSAPFRNEVFRTIEKTTAASKPCHFLTLRAQTASFYRLLQSADRVLEKCRAVFLSLSTWCCSVTSIPLLFEWINFPLPWQTGTSVYMLGFFLTIWPYTRLRSSYIVEMRCAEKIAHARTTIIRYIYIDIHR